MTTTRYLIVNADDLGQSPGITRGILAAHARGIVSSASLMVRWPAAADAVARCREHPALGLGLHLDLGEWIYRQGAWAPLYEVVDPGDAVAVRDEVRRQLDAFRRLTGGEPTHVDSHQHVHLRQPVRAIVLEEAGELGIPVRRCTADIGYCGSFYGQTAEGQPYPEGIEIDSLCALLSALPPGLTELACHPGEAEDVQTMYRQERAVEVETLCAAQVHATLLAEGIELCSFRSWKEKTAPRFSGALA